MTRLGNGVVYGDDEGRVVYAADDGSRLLLGHKDPDVPVAATDETGLGRLGRPGHGAAVRSWSRRPHRQRRPASAGRRRARAWSPSTATPSTSSTRRGPRAAADRPHLGDPGQPRPTSSTSAPGSAPSRWTPAPSRSCSPTSTWPSSCPGGAPTSRRTATSWPPGCPDDGEVALYDTRTGAELPTARRATTGAGRRAGGGSPSTYVVAPAWPSPGTASSQLRTCDLRTSSAGSWPGSRRRLDAGAGTLRAWHAPVPPGRRLRLRPAHRQPGRGRPRRRRPRRRPDAAVRAVDQPLRDHVPAAARPPTGPTTGCASSPRAASCRSRATRRSAARTPGSRRAVRRSGAALVQECARRAGDDRARRAARVPGAAADQGRPGRRRGPRPRSPPPCGIDARRRRGRQVGRQRPGLGRRTPRGRPRRPRPEPRPRRLRRARDRRRRPLDRRRLGRRRRGPCVLPNGIGEDPVTGSLNASLGQWLAGTRLPSSTSPPRAPRSAAAAGCT